MKKIIYVLFLSFATLNFVGCSDGYDEALQDTTPKEITKEDVQKATDDAQQVAKENNVSLSETTTNRFKELNTTLQTIEDDLVNKTALEKVNEIIKQATEAIETVKIDIAESNISEEEKESAILKIDKIKAEIEREQFKDGLTAYTEALQNNNSNECPSTDNTSSLPPALPSDQCTNKQ